jgi:hypothetical protein
MSKEKNTSYENLQEQEQQLNAPLTNEPIAEAEQPSTLNLQPLNPDMEVHHHTHHEHGKRNWKSYFWEFLMLFLAVSGGWQRRSLGSIF